MARKTLVVGDILDTTFLDSLYKQFIRIPITKFTDVEPTITFSLNYPDGYAIGIAPAMADVFNEQIETIFYLRSTFYLME